MLDTDSLKKFVALEEEETKLELRLKQIEAEKKLLDATIQENFLAEDIDQVRINGRTVFIKPQPYPVTPDKEETIKLLRDAGGGFAKLVGDNYNSNSLRAYLKEMEENEIPLPESFKDKIYLDKKYAVVSRKA